MKKNLLIMLPILLMIVSNSKMIAQTANTIDGNYCPRNITNDEWVNADSFAANINATSSCEVERVWARANYDDKQVEIALVRGNQGTATFLFYINSDCDSTTGDVSPRPSGNGTRGGAEYRIQIEVKNNGTTTVEDVGEWNGTGYDVAASAGIAASGVSDGCSGSNSNFIEFALPYEEIFEPCLADGCDIIEFSSIETKSGGSISSSDCQDLSTTIQLNLNEPPSPFFTVDDSDVCLENNPTINLDASQTNDPDIGPLEEGDNLSWEWTSDRDGSFAQASGTNAQLGIEMNTTYTPNEPGLHQISLTVTDKEGCSVNYADNSAQITVGKEPEPVIAVQQINFEPIQIQYDGSGSVEYLTSANGFSDNLTYEWTFGNGNTSTTVSGTETFQSQGNTTITLTVTDPDSPTGCNQATQTFQIFLLPIQLTSFSGSFINDTAVELNWTTASEINNEVFIIERSYEGGQWHTAGTLPGAGDSTTELNYSFTDFPSVYEEVVYYRLKQVDYDGESSTSDIIQLNRVVENNRIFISQPSRSSVVLNFELLESKQLQSIQVFNTTGKLVNHIEKNIRVSAGSSQELLDITQYSKGLYILILDFEDGRKESIKFIK